MRRFPRGPLADVGYKPRTLNIYKSAFEAPRDRRLVPLGWEKPGVRIVGVVSWLLDNAKSEGLTTRDDGFVRVQEVLQHPRLGNLDFLTLEKAIGAFGAHSLRLKYQPRTLGYGISGSNVDSWWIGLWGKSKGKASYHRLLNETSVAIHRVPSEEWPLIREEGISRTKRSILFSIKDSLPHDYCGDHTFISLDIPKTLNRLRLPLYKAFTKGFGDEQYYRPRENIQTRVRNIPSSAFGSVVRVAVKRHLLLSRKALEPDDRENASQLGKFLVHKTGVDALGRHGYADIVEKSSWGLASVLEKNQEDEGTKSRASNDSDKSSAKIKNVTTKAPLTSKSTHRPVQGPNPHSPIRKWAR